MLTDNRLGYLDFLRFLSIVGVIFLHVSADVIFNKNLILTKEWYTGWIYDNIFRWCVPMFIMISGVLFVEKSNAVFEPKRYLIEKIGRLLVPFLVWSIFYIFWRERYNQGFLLNISFIQIVKEIFSQPTYYHLWFMYMILGLYFIGPLIGHILKKDSNSIYVKYFLIIWIVFASIKGLISKITGIYIRIDIDFLTGAVPYCVLGHFLNNLKISRTIFVVSVISFILSSAATYLLNMHAYKIYGDMEISFFSYPSPNITLQVASIFILVKYIYIVVQPLKHLNIFLTTSSSLVFGIYLIHPFILEQIKSGKFGFTLDAYSLPCILSIPLLVIVCFTVSWLVCYLISRIKALRGFLI